MQLRRAHSSRVCCLLACFDCLLQPVHFDAGVRHWLIQLTALFGEVGGLIGGNFYISLPSLNIKTGH
jgi:hypothetical protein